MSAVADADDLFGREDKWAHSAGVERFDVADADDLFGREDSFR